MLDFLYSLAIAFLLSFLGEMPIMQVPKDTMQSQSTFATESARVVRVVDGDTLKVDKNGVIETTRVIGINTPETVDPRKEVECFGKEASAFAKEFFASASAQVVLTRDPTQGDRDKYQRLLRYISVNGDDYGASAIANGYAYEYTYDEPHAKQQEYQQLQKNAQKLEVGLWSPDACRK